MNCVLHAQDCKLTLVHPCMYAHTYLHNLEVLKGVFL